MAPPRWLLVGALSAETLPVRRRLTDTRTVAPGIIEGELAGLRVALATIGVGPGRAHRNTAAAIEQWKPERVLNFGTCGALVDTLSVGDLCCVTEVLREGPQHRCDSVASLIPLLVGTPARLVTVDRAVHEPPRRAALAENGAQICDMEGTAIAVAAGDLPFSALKVVSDAAGGDPADAIFSKKLPQPVAIARFKARARRLVARVVLPALEAVLAG